MPGVDILHTFEVVTEYGFNMRAFLLSIFWLSVISGIIGAIISLLDSETGVLFFFSILIFGGMIAAAWNAESLPITTEMHHQVIISDQVSYTEFVAKYEVIEQNGRIYTVKERQN